MSVTNPAPTLSSGVPGSPVPEFAFACGARPSNKGCRNTESCVRRSSPSGPFLATRRRRNRINSHNSRNTATSSDIACWVIPGTTDSPSTRACKPICPKLPKVLIQPSLWNATQSSIWAGSIQGGNGPIGSMAPPVDVSKPEGATDSAKGSSVADCCTGSAEEVCSSNPLPESSSPFLGISPAAAN